MPRIEGFKRVPSEHTPMSEATKVVLGTVGVAGLFAVVIILALAL
ncbi:hypothetical protein [Halorarius litoreus]|nr:hypothetical protein [Halorarius litoreus]